MRRPARWTRAEHGSPVGSGADALAGPDAGRAREAPGCRRLAAFPVSDASPFMTGETVVIDGALARDNGL
jgi:hypothetical protein